MKRYDTVIFDLDGTLLNTLDDLASAINHALDVTGFPVRTIDEVRRFVGNDYRFLIPGSALCGGVLLLLSDIVSRVLIAPTVLPIGALTSFLGAPLFLYLIVKGGRGK